MSQLNDIKGYYRALDKEGFDENHSWEGKLLLEDDGWFEGIVKEKNKDFDGDIMIFGIYHPEKLIELVKTAPEYISEPFIFRGTKYDEDGYIGQFSLATLLGEMICGNSIIKTNEKEYNIEEVNELQKRIDKFKLSRNYEEMYENVKAIKAQLSDQALRDYECRHYTEEEFANVITEIEPTLEKVEKETVKGIKKLFKRKK